MTELHPAEEDSSPAVVNNNAVDAVVAALLMVLGAVVIYEARRLGSGWGSDGPGAGYFPFYIGIIICVSGLGIIYQALFSKNRDTGVFVNRLQLGRVLQVLLPAVAYVAAITLLGVYVASALYIAGFMIVLGKYSVLKSALVAVAVNALFFMMFEVWFKVPLFKGKLEPLGFLGY